MIRSLDRRLDATVARHGSKLSMSASTPMTAMVLPLTEVNHTTESLNRMKASMPKISRPRNAPSQ